MRDDVFCVVMAGGTGTRLWPLSQPVMPKQFLDVMGVGRTMLQLTFDRYSKICKPDNFVVVTLEEFLPFVREQLPELPSACVLTEPFKRNTAACVEFASAYIRQRSPNAIIVAAPSDHVIMDNDVFVSSVLSAIDYADGNDELVSIGIKALRPDTAFGYIQVGEQIGGGEVHKVKTFTEKPESEMAQMFFECGDFCWNSGVFVAKLPALDAAFAKFMPNLYQLFASLDTMPISHWTPAIVRQIYEECENTSVSYGVFEKARNVAVCLSSAAWSDIGSWDAIYEQAHKDKALNAVVSGSSLVKNSEGCLVHVDNNLVCVVDGLSNFLVVKRGNMLLICPREKAPNSWQYVSELKAEIDL